MHSLSIKTEKWILYNFIRWCLFFVIFWTMVLIFCYFLLAVILEEDESSLLRMPNWTLAVLASHWPLLTALLSYTWMANIVTFHLKHPKWDQNLQFTPLSKMTSIPITFTWESPPTPQGAEPLWKFALYGGTGTEASIIIISHRISFELINTLIYFK